MESDNPQKVFWKSEFGTGYRERNSQLDSTLEEKAWKEMLRSFNSAWPNSYLECGSNIGRNLHTLKRLSPGSDLSLIEINKESYEIAVSSIQPTFSYNGSIENAPFENGKFDLVYTMGVLIHIPPYDLYLTMKKMHELSSKYILMGEYFSRELELPLYHGQKNKMYRMDYGKYFVKNFDVQVVDYGFLWGYEFDKGGFDDVTWWLFEKNKKGK